MSEVAPAAPSPVETTEGANDLGLFGSDSAELGHFGLMFTAVGLLLLTAAVNLMMYPLPPTLDLAVAFMLALALGIAFLATGVLYYLAGAGHVRPRLGPQGLCVSEHPDRKEPEFIALANIQKAVLRPWPLSPWWKTHRYYELELTVREGNVDVNDTFLLHLHPGYEEFAASLRKALGGRVEIAGH